jgi:signal transduction histidine kinase/pSer/pThr/pTyr-binding forkhead associated (FHA) protein
MPRLIVLAGPDSGKEFILPAGDSSLGRSETNTIVLTDPLVSRQHCELKSFGNQFVLTDLGSGNGTLVNGSSIATATLAFGDRIAIGDTVLTFTTDGTFPPVIAPSGVVRTVPEDAGSVILARPELVGSEWLRTRLAHLGVLYEASTAVNEILDVDELLGRLLDLTMRSTDADEGVVLLADEETGEWMPRVRRTKSQSSPMVPFSRTIVDYIRRERVGVLATDAGTDDRFVGGESIVRQGIREVIAVPMKGRREVVGAILVETIASAVREPSLRSSKFSDDHLTLASALAHQAALAVEETRYYKALLHTEKLAAVGTAIASLSHDIKNIMHGVRFGSDLVRRGLAGNDPELLKTGWRLVERNQIRIDDLIQDMLNYSKDREPALESIDLAKLVSEVMDEIRQRLGESNVSITFESCEIPDLMFDPVGLHRAILNVITNAVDAVKDSPDPGIILTLHRPDDRAVELIVSDTGPGVPAEMKEEIFKPFVSSKGNRGTGLGLPVSRKILREHGGDLTAEDGPGGRFVFRIPLR